MYWYWLGLLIYSMQLLYLSDSIIEQRTNIFFLCFYKIVLMKTIYLVRLIRCGIHFSPRETIVQSHDSSKTCLRHSV